MTTDQFLDISTYAFPVLIIILAVNLKEKLYRFRKTKNKLQYFSIQNFKIVYLALALFIFTLFFNTAIPEKELKTAAQLVEYGQRTKSPTHELEGLKLAHFNNPKDQVSCYKYYEKLIALEEKNSDLITNLKDELISQKGNFLELACLSTLTHNYQKAAFYVISLDEDEPVTCFLKAQVALYKQDTTQFINYLLKEINNEGLKTNTYPLLAEYFSQTNQSELLYDLVKSDIFLEYLDFNLIGRVYYAHGDIYRYIFSTVMHILNHLSIYSFIGALVILIAYTVFLRELDLFNKESWGWVIVMVTYGAISPFFVFPFSNFLEYSLNFNPQGSSIGNFLYYTVRVGLVEEYVKLFPFLLFLLFTKKMKEPYDYIFYATLSALGFAFTENILYFTNHGTAIIQSRGMLSVLGHAIFTSSVGYLMAYSRFKKKLAPTPILFVFGLMLASLLHGVFDFLLLPNSFTNLIFFIYFLILIHVWAVMLNNCMNNSSYFDYSKLKNLKNFQFIVTGSLLLIITTQHVLTTFYVGKSYANAIALGGFYPGIYIILFLSNTLGRFDFFKNYWESLLPKIKDILLPRTANTNEYVGLSIALSPKPSTPLSQLETIRGTIVERKIHNKDPNWYMVQLTQELPFQNIHSNLLLMYFGNEDVSLEHENNNSCETYVLPNSIDYSKIKIEGEFLLGGECFINSSN